MAISSRAGRTQGRETVVPPPPRLIRRKLRADDLETVLTSSAAVRREMLAKGCSLLASSWRETRRGVAMELVFSPARLED